MRVFRLGFLHSSVSKAPASNAGDLGSTPDLGSSPAEVNGNLLQYSCLENPMDRGACQATVHGIARVRHDLALSFFLSCRFIYKKKNPIKQWQRI